MKVLKKILPVSEYIKRQGYARQHQGQIDRSKGDRSKVPSFKKGAIVLKNTQSDLVQSWYKPKGFAVKTKK